MSAGLLDTSVLIDWDDPAVAVALPDEAAICAVTVAELTAGPHLAATKDEAARRQVLLQQIEATFEPIAFDLHAARSYGQIIAAVVAVGRPHRGRFADLLIAATAHANSLPVYTRNAADFLGLDGLIEIISI